MLDISQALPVGNGKPTLKDFTRRLFWSWLFPFTAGTTGKANPSIVHLHPLISMRARATVWRKV